VVKSLKPRLALDHEERSPASDGRAPRRNVVDAGLKYTARLSRSFGMAYEHCSRNELHDARNWLNAATGALPIIYDGVRSMSAYRLDNCRRPMHRHRKSKGHRQFDCASMRRKSDLSQASGLSPGFLMNFNGFFSSRPYGLSPCCKLLSFVPWWFNSRPPVQGESGCAPPGHQCEKIRHKGHQRTRSVIIQACGVWCS